MNDDLTTLLWQAWPYRKPLALASALMAVQSGCALMIPWLGGKLAASLIGSAPDSAFSINLVFLAMAGLFALQASLALGHGYLLAATADRMAADLRVKLYDHAQSLPVGFYHERSRGAVLTLLTQDVDILAGFMTGGLVTLAPSIMTFAGALVMMVRVDWRLGAAAGLAVPAFFLALQLMSRAIRPVARDYGEAISRLTARAEGNLGLMPIIKAFTREVETSIQYEGEVRRLQALSTRYSLARLGLGPVVELVATFGVLLLVWLATRDALVGALAPASLVTFMMYGLLLTRPMSGLASVYGEAQHAREVTKRLLDFLQTAPEAENRSGRRLTRVSGAIRFEDVWFGYSGRRPTFEHLNLSVSAGETVALTGPNGAGKSTLISLLMRFVVPQRGRILIDGVDASTVSLSSLRTQIGLVPQNMLLLGGTVRDNIAAGRVDAGEPAIEAAARAACAHDFIMRLPAGYETSVGESGVKLSGGQQQRIALARALLKNPPILVLDEATAMFDLEGEEEFLEFLKTRLRDRTVILITHRAASLKLADRIVRLEAGTPCVVEA